MRSNNIGFGFLCFGNKIYYKGTEEKIIKLSNLGYTCYILTDEPEYFKHYDTINIKYNRGVYSYYDKVTLINIIFEKSHNIAVIIDSDSDIVGYDWVNFISDYEFKDGVTYIDTLVNHISNKKHIKELNLISNEWVEYTNYAKSLLNNFEEYELIWEYVLIFNKDGFNIKKFFETYSKLQIVKESTDIRMNKKIIGAGEGISILISCIKNNIPLQLDQIISNELRKEIRPISSHYTPKNKLPIWMRQF
jgi:hypothetical protein